MNKLQALQPATPTVPLQLSEQNLHTIRNETVQFNLKVTTAYDAWPSGPTYILYTHILNYFGKISICTPVRVVRRDKLSYLNIIKVNSCLGQNGYIFCKLTIIVRIKHIFFVIFILNRTLRRTKSYKTSVKLDFAVFDAVFMNLL